jgi:hypothetical protein
VLKHWQLPESFRRLRQLLEGRHGARAGVRHYVRVLQLLAEHPLERVRLAVEACVRRDEVHAERIATAVRVLSSSAAPTPPVTPLCQYPVLARVADEQAAGIVPLSPLLLD